MASTRVWTEPVPGGPWGLGGWKGPGTAGEWGTASGPRKGCCDVAGGAPPLSSHTHPLQAQCPSPPPWGWGLLKPQAGCSAPVRSRAWPEGAARHPPLQRPPPPTPGGSFRRDLSQLPAGSALPTVWTLGGSPQSQGGVPGPLPLKQQSRASVLLRSPTRLRPGSLGHRAATTRESPASLGVPPGSGDWWPRWGWGAGQPPGIPPT